MDIIYIVGILSGILYIIFDFIYDSISYYVILKPIPIWTLSVYCTSRRNYMLAVGLIFGALGDIFLIYEGEFYFQMGLFLFLIGHILYFIYFFNRVNFNKQGFFISLVMFLFALGVSYVIFQNLPTNLLLPVGMYIFVITMMGFSAAFYNIFTAIGALFFLISDSIIALNKFVTTIPYSNLWIMIFYYLAQWGISYGGCKESA